MPPNSELQHQRSEWLRIIDDQKLVIQRAEPFHLSSIEKI